MNLFDQKPKSKEPPEGQKAPPALLKEIQARVNAKGYWPAKKPKKRK